MNLSMLLLLLAADPQVDRYLRPGGAGFVLECQFTTQKQDDGRRIDSETQRGKTTMRVNARYDADDRLRAASAELTEGGQKSTVTVMVEQGKATVRRPGQPAQEFDVPPGVIVTSAPDWTDVYWLARRFDPKKDGKQEHAGLWIHPTQPAQLLRFSIAKTGSDIIEHAQAKVTLTRCEIRIRGNSGYTAWVDDAGNLIRLLPLTAKAGGMVRAGYEQSAGQLRP